MKKIFINLSLSLLSLVIFFSAAEIISGFYLAKKHKLNEYASLIEQQGFTPKNKKPGEKRFFIVGESAARGVPYQMDESFSGFLQKLTSQVDPNVRIINTGIPGRHSFYQKEEFRTILKYKPDAVIIYAGNNDTRDFSNVMRDVPFAHLEFKLFWNSAFYRVLKKKVLGFRHKIQQKMAKREIAVNQNQDDVWHWTDHYLQKKKEYIEDTNKGIARKQLALQDYENNLEYLVRKLKQRRVNVVIATLPIVHTVMPIIGDHPRKGYQFNLKLRFASPDQKNQWGQLTLKGKREYKSKNYNQSLDYFLKALALNGEHPMLYHNIGRIYLKLGDPVKARQYFELAKDKQIQSPGGDSFKNEALRRIANKYDCPLIEVQPSFEAISPSGIVGKNLFLDHCHPNSLGHKVLAASVMAGLCRNKEVACASNQSDWQYWFEILSFGKPSNENLAREYILTGFYLINGTAWEPEPNYKEALYYLEKAKALWPESPDLYSFLAPCYAKLNRPKDAVESLAKLKKLSAEKYAKTLETYPFLQPLTA